MCYGGRLLGRGGGPGFWFDVRGLRAALPVQLGLRVAGSCGVVARLRAVLCRDGGPGRGCWRRGCRGCLGSGSSGCLLGRGGGPGCWFGGRGLRAAYLVQFGLWVAASCGVVVSRGCGASPRGLCRVVVWFSPGFFHNKPGTFCLINGYGKAFAFGFKKNKLLFQFSPYIHVVSLS